MNNTKERYFDELGDDFERFMDNYDVQRRCCLIFMDLLKDVDLKNKKVLEIGCGTGRISSEIVSRQAILTVVDIGENLVQYVSNKYHCEGIAADACKLPIEDNSFDIVISSECIEHTTNPVKAIHEMCRACKPGGIVCITSPNKLWYPILWLSIKLNIRKFKGIENWLFPRQASSAMKQSRMEGIQLSGCHLWPFQLKFTRPILQWCDNSLGRRLFPFMINYGIRGTKGGI
ncbi:class I SAM-dependent methyltransferase [bacterium]|nr:class I SAM-dependent methyltransferase [bacterium]